MSITKAKIAGSIVDMRGDGVWSAMSDEIRKTVIDPFFNVDWDTHDISLQSRDKTDDKVLDDAIAALQEHRAAVKGPTVTPTAKQAKDMGLKKKWGSPNGKARRGINGAAIFRTPFEISGMDKFAPHMNDVTIARQAVGGIYGAPEFELPGQGTLKITFTDDKGEQTLIEREIKDSGVGMATLETDSSITDYAHAIFQQAITMRKPVVFAAKSTINPVYDGRFVNTLINIFEKEYAEKFADANITFMAKDPSGDDLLIDAIAAKIPQGKLNGTIVALRNYDGDVISDEVAGAHKSLGMMDSVLISADGILLADPPHGTAPDLEQAYHDKGILLANPAAHIMAYAEALRHKAALNGETSSAARALLLKDAVLKTIEDGYKNNRVTGDLAQTDEQRASALNGQEFLALVQDTYKSLL